MRKRSRGGSKPVSLARFSPAGVQIVKARVEDPYEPGEKLPVLKNIRVHPVDHLLARRKITPIQADAANRFLQLYDRAVIGAARAIDYSIPKVDVSHTARGIAMGAAGATAALLKIRAEVGDRVYLVLRQLIGERANPARMASAMREWRKAKTLYAEIRIALNALVSYWGMDRRAKAKPQEEYVREIKPFTGPLEVEMKGDRLKLVAA